MDSENARCAIKTFARGADKCHLGAISSRRRPRRRRGGRRRGPRRPRSRLCPRGPRIRAPFLHLKESTNEHREPWNAHVLESPVDEHRGAELDLVLRKQLLALLELRDADIDIGNPFPQLLHNRSHPVHLMCLDGGDKENVGHRSMLAAPNLTTPIKLCGCGSGRGSPLLHGNRIIRSGPFLREMWLLVASSAAEASLLQRESLLRLAKWTESGRISPLQILRHDRFSLVPIPYLHLYHDRIDHE